MRRVNQFVQNFLLTKGVPLSVLPYAAPPKGQGPKGQGPKGPTGAGQGPTPTGAQSLMGGDFSRTRFPQESFAAALPPAALSVITADAARGNAAPADWRTTPEGQAAADSNRSQQDTDARYWERADMETWAKAHSTLAKIAGKF